MSLPTGYTLVRRDPTGLSLGAIDSAIAVLQMGHAVDTVSARRGLPASKALFFLYYEEELVGLGAVKRQRSWYAKRIAEKSEHEFDSAMLELGYVAVCRGHRGLHLSGHLVEALLVAYRGGLFATTDDKNMKSTLGNRGFKRYGVEWKGSRGWLSLWLRMPNK